ncbi:MAG: glycosyltransferase family 39 protein [Candidatus Bathyarchaeota archaeon]|nr:glycosyltransferase family 39 protein [Candidatus Bathyarchaeota archaeon]
MRVRNVLSKERLVNSLKSLGKLRIKVSHGSLLTFSTLVLILFIAFTIRLFPLRWEIDPAAGSTQLHLSEFDPYFQYRFAEYVLKNGFISWAWPTQWVDTQRWYPGGINIATGGLPGLPLTAAFLYSIISALGVDIGLMDFCAIWPAIMGALACLVLYFLGKDIGGKPVGLLAALFLALSPSYIQRTQVGFFDDETIGIFALLLFMLLFLRAIDRDRSLGSSMKYALASGMVLGYFCSGWGVAYYAIGITVLFAFLSVLLKRYTQRLLLSYSLTFGFGLFIATCVPKLSTTYLTTGVVLPVAGVFILLCFCEAFRALTSTKWRTIFIVILLAVLVGGFSVLWQFGYIRGIAGKFTSVINPLFRAGIPLIESVAEHRISAWGSMYYDLGIVIIFFLAGFFFILRDLNDKNLFLLIFGLSSLYFACSMVRLLVVMAPAFGLLAAVGITRILKPFNTLLKESPKISVKKKYVLQPVGKEFSGSAIFLIFLILMTSFAFPMPKVYRQAWTPVTISAGSLPIVPAEPVHEWLDMLNWVQSNLEGTTVVCSWWDYGYWLTIVGNVTTLADNATINTTQIQNIGFIFMANETQALEMLKLYDAKYILVFTTLDVNGRWIGYGDEGKWMWMARISGKASDRLQSSWTDESAFGKYNSSTRKWDWNPLGMNSTIYKLMAWGKHRWCEGKVRDPEEDEWIRNGLSAADIEPKYFKEAYFAGLDAGQEYGGIVPLICLYKIDYPS